MPAPTPVRRANTSHRCRGGGGTGTGTGSRAARGRVSVGAGAVVVGVASSSGSPGCSRLPGRLGQLAGLRRAACFRCLSRSALLSAGPVPGLRPTGPAAGRSSAADAWRPGKTPRKRCGRALRAERIGSTPGLTAAPAVHQMQQVAHFGCSHRFVLPARLPRRGGEGAVVCPFDAPVRATDGRPGLAW